MQTVTQIADDIVAREGGFVNDPDDPGGPTNFGVTLATLRGLGLDLDGNGAVDMADLHALTKSGARAIFIRHYYERPGISRLPEALRAPVFDMYVNAGANAVRILQRLLCQMGEEVAVDGVIGPRSLAAAQRVARRAPAHLGDAYGIARRNYYYALGDRRPALRKFARRRDGGKGGWIRRAEAFMSPAFRLSDEEHARRVATWD